MKRYCKHYIFYLLFNGFLFANGRSEDREASLKVELDRLRKEFDSQMSNLEQSKSAIIERMLKENEGVISVMHEKNVRLTNEIADLQVSTTLS